VFKFYYAESLNKIIKKPVPFILNKFVPTPGMPKPKPEFPLPEVGFWFDGIVTGNWSPDNPYVGIGLQGPSNLLCLYQVLPQNIIKPGGRYTLSFRVKGRKVQEARAVVMTAGWLVRDLASAQKEGLKPKNQAADVTSTDFGFPVGATWSTVSKTFDVKLADRDLNNPGKWTGANSKLEYGSILGFRAEVEGDDGVYYIDNVKLVEER